MRSIASRLAIFGLVAASWWWTARVKLSVAGDLVCILGGPLAVYPTVLLGCKLLATRPTKEFAEKTTIVVHAAIGVFYGVAVIKAISLFGVYRGEIIDWPKSIVHVLFLFASVIATLTVANLALKAWGAPFALILSRNLATSWLYRWTRNPMVIASFLWLVTIGLELQSSAFIAWVVLVLSPAELIFLKLYEERELEIRFGGAYRAYKATTPFLLPLPWG
ncbi:MAG: isoprenylcysteine carboxylmethyltransferase family protein [Alphaproteobacteria bacterium]|nr:isoprenylcysteine carboxylmethyltransferase family protein [Alphaproteobacteria bacterium]